jgi:hypothetical protein
MNNIFLSSDCCDSFEKGVVVTTLPRPVDIRDDMGVNLCELSLSGVANIPPGLEYGVMAEGKGEKYRTQLSRCFDAHTLLNSLSLDKRFSFDQLPGGEIRADFPAESQMDFGEELELMTGYEGSVVDGDVARPGDLFRFVPFMVAEIDIVAKNPVGNEVRRGLRLVPLEYRNGENVRFQFDQPNFVPLKKGIEIETIKFYLTTVGGNIVQFVPGGSLQAHLQLAPVKSRLLL